MPDHCQRMNTAPEAIDAAVDGLIAQRKASGGLKALNIELTQRDTTRTDMRYYDVMLAVNGGAARRIGLVSLEIENDPTTPDNLYCFGVPLPVVRDDDGTWRWATDEDSDHNKWPMPDKPDRDYAVVNREGLSETGAHVSFFSETEAMAQCAAWVALVYFEGPSEETCRELERERDEAIRVVRDFAEFGRCGPAALGDS